MTAKLNVLIPEQVSEGLDTLSKINDVYCDTETHCPIQVTFLTRIFTHLWCTNALT